MRSNIIEIIGAIGLVVMLVAAALPLLNVSSDGVRYAYAAAAVVVLVSRVLTPAEGSTLRLRRLHRISIMSAVLYCASAVIIFLPRLAPQWAAAAEVNGNEWVALLLAGAVVHLYASWMTERELKHECDNAN